MHPHGAPIIPQRALAATLMRIAALAMLCALACPSALATTLVVRDDGSSAGYVTLGWTSDGASAVELQQRGAGGAWRTLYQGMDRASTLSGLPDGVYAFRARAGPSGDWGPVLEVTIAHHPLSRALASLVAGALMFVVLLVCIAAPHRRAHTGGHDGAATRQPS